jgi:hypothetical protein
MNVGDDRIVANVQTVSIDWRGWLPMMISTLFAMR